jgi:cell division protease FtsH
MLTRAGMGDTISSGMGTGLAAKDDLDRRVETKLRELYARAGELLEANRWLVLAIANAMLQRRTITGEDIDAIYHGTRGPTVDGAWFHLPATRQRLEDFHLAAVAAHQAHEVTFDIDPPSTPVAAVTALPPPKAAISLTRSWPPPRRHG